MRTSGEPDVQVELDSLEEQVASFIPRELVAGVEGQNSADVEDQQEVQVGQTTFPGDQLVCDIQPADITTLPPMGEDTFQHLMDTFKSSHPVLVRVSR